MFCNHTDIQSAFDCGYSGETSKQAGLAARSAPCPAAAVLLPRCRISAVPMSPGEPTACSSPYPKREEKITPKREGLQVPRWQAQLEDTAEKTALRRGTRYLPPRTITTCPRGKAAFEEKQIATPTSWLRAARRLLHRAPLLATPAAPSPAPAPCGAAPSRQHRHQRGAAPSHQHRHQRSAAPSHQHRHQRSAAPSHQHQRSAVQLLLIGTSTAWCSSLSLVPAPAQHGAAPSHQHQHHAVQLPLASTSTGTSAVQLPLAGTSTGAARCSSLSPAPAPARCSSLSPAPAPAQRSSLSPTPAQRGAAPSHRHQHCAVQLPLASTNTGTSAVQLPLAGTSTGTSAVQLPLTGTSAVQLPLAGTGSHSWRGSLARRRACPACCLPGMPLRQWVLPAAAEGTGLGSPRANCVFFPLLVFPRHFVHLGNFPEASSAFTRVLQGGKRRTTDEVAT